MKLFGGTTANVIEAIGSAVDKVFTSDDERLDKATLLAKLQQEINLAELQTRSIFLSGWRPFLGWGLAFAIIFRTVLFPILTWTLSIWGIVLPPFDASIDKIVLELIFAMLGLAGMRTYEKQKGLTK